MRATWTRKRGARCVSRWRGRSSLQRFTEQQLALLPVAADGPVGHAQRLCNLGLGQAAKVAQLDDLGQPWSDCGEIVERFMDGEDLFGAAAALVGNPRRQRHLDGTPPRRPAVRRRAKSTITDRITRPAQRKKWTRSWMFSAPDVANRKYDSWTSEPVSSKVLRPPETSRIRASLQRDAYVAANKRSAASASPFSAR